MRVCVSYPVGVDSGPGGVGGRGHVEGTGDEVLLSIHEVLQILFLQKALEELTVVGAGKLHAVIPLQDTHIHTLMDNSHSTHG